MKAIDTINPAIEKTKKLLFPIKYKAWLKLALVSFIARNNKNPISRIGGNIGRFSDKLGGLKALLPFMIGGGLIVFILAIAYSWVKHIFSFIFIDSIITKKTLIKKYFNKHTSKGTSVFLWKLLIGLIGLSIIALSGLPLIISIIKNIPDFDLSMFTVGSMIIYILILICAIAVVALITIILNVIIFNFTIIDMYIKNTKFLPSFKTSLKVVKNNIGEVIVYILLKIGMSMVVAMIALVILLPLLLIFLIAGGLLAAPFIIISIMVPPLLILMIILGVLFGIPLFLLFVYAFEVFLLPASVFFTRYAYDFYKSLIKKS